MATNIDKALYQAPMGLGDDTEAEGIEVEIIPDTEGDDLLAEVDALLGEDQEDSFNANLAETMDHADLSELASDLIDAIDIDKEAHEKRDQQYEEGLRRTYAWFASR